MSPPKEGEEENPGEFRRKVLDTHKTWGDFLRDPERSGVQLATEFSYLSLLCLQPSVYTHPPHLIGMSVCALYAASRDPPA